MRLERDYKYSYLRESGKAVLSAFYFFAISAVLRWKNHFRIRQAKPSSELNANRYRCSSALIGGSSSLGKEVLATDEHRWTRISIRRWFSICESKDLNLNPLPRTPSVFRLREASIIREHQPNPRYPRSIVFRNGTRIARMKRIFADKRLMTRLRNLCGHNDRHGKVKCAEFNPPAFSTQRR